MSATELLAPFTLIQQYVLEIRVYHRGKIIPTFEVPEDGRDDDPLTGVRAPYTRVHRASQNANSQPLLEGPVIRLSPAGTNTEARRASA